MLPGMAATTAPLPLPMVLTVPPTTALAIIHLPELTHVVGQSRTDTAAKAPLKRTTQAPELMDRLIKPPTPIGATEAPPCRRTARLLTRSIKRRPKAPLGRCKLRTVARLLPGRVSTTAAPPVRRQMATSMRRRTATNTKTPAVDGRKTRTEAGTMSRNLAARVTVLLI